MSTPIALEQTRLCSSCGTIWPIDQFRHHNSGSDRRLYECRACHNRKEKARREAHRLGRLLSGAARVHRARNPGELQAVLRALLLQFGGIDGLAAEVEHQLRAAAPGSPRALRLATMVMELAQHNGGAR